MKTKTLIAGIVLAALLVTVSSVSAATIWTDKEDYQPEEIVYISGSGFSDMTDLTSITVTRPDGTVDVCGSRCINCSGDLPFMFDGTFSNYEYDLDGIFGIYTVEVSDGDNDAEVTFSDGLFIRPKTYSDSIYSNDAYMFKDGDIVYAKVTKEILQLRPSKFEWRDEAGIIVQTSPCNSGSGSFYDSYILSGANTGTWTVTRVVYNKGDISCSGSDKGSETTGFDVYEGRLLTPTDDAYVRENRPNGNYGNNGIHVKVTATNKKKQSYFKFDLSDLPEDCQITSAKLHLYRHVGRAIPENVGVYNVSSDVWTEGEITWNNAPGMGSQLDNTDVNGLNSDQDGGYFWDVTSEAKSEFAGDKTLSLGLKFTDESIKRQHQDFCDKELRGRQCQDDLYPYLEIVCGVDPIPEFSTIALPAVSILGLFLFFNHRKRREV